MKTLLTIYTLVFTVMFSSTSHADWTKVDEFGGETHYVDFERIRKVDGFVYYWVLVDYLKPENTGELSAKAYQQGDCKLFRYKYLSISSHKEPMGVGSGKSFTYNDNDWKYPPPNSSGEVILKEVCQWRGYWTKSGNIREW